MGTINSRDTRRISFDNKFALNSALSVQKTNQEENIVGYDSLFMDTVEADELLYKGSNKIIEPLENNETNYWSYRIEHLKKEHHVINQILESEYDKEIESINKTYESPKITQERIQRIKPCFELRAKTMKCYEENPHQPLRCSAIVEAFNQYVTCCRVED